MLTISLRDDYVQIAQMYPRQQKQVRFAAAVALTRTAKDLQGEIQKDMPANFTIRRDWVIKGIRIKPATRDRLQAEVYSRDPFMAIQETGGTKYSIQRRVFDYGKYLAIPLAARRSKADIVQKKDWPQNLINPFILTARDGRKYLAVHAIAYGKGTRSVKGLSKKQRNTTGTRLMYTLVERSQLKARLGMRRVAQALAVQRFNHHMSETLPAAFASAR